MSELNPTNWRKSGRSNAEGGACVEAAPIASVVAVRDSKDAQGPKLVFTRAGRQTFTGRVKAGRFDRPSRSAE